MLRQNGGLNGCGLVSGGAIGALSGGARNPILAKVNAKLKLERKENNRQFTAYAKSVRKAAVAEHKAAKAPQTERAIKARARALSRAADLANMQAMEVGVPIAPLMGMGAQGYYGGRRR
jgi:hypothetical protein